MLDNLGERLGEIFKRLRSRGKLTPDDVNEALREVRRALLDADVSLKIIKKFIDDVRVKATGAEVWESLSPGQLVIKFVRDELVELMGGTNQKIAIASQPPTVILLMGLNGAGKTTTCAKLALHLRGQGHRPIMVAADVYRPAAITQLQVLGKQLGIPVFADLDTQDPVVVCQNARAAADKENRDVVLVDTSGRQHVDAELMAELGRMKQAVKPHEVLLVVDAMTGQDAVNIAEQFDQQIGVDGIVLTKLDGDARGGAALSVKAVTGKSIKFTGTGEKISALEPFYPDRLVSRILGMGDILSLIEKAESSITEEKAEELAEKFRTAEFDLEDYLDQLSQIRKMGSIQELLAMIPGLGPSKEMKNMAVDEKAFSRIAAIIQSMTPHERRNPKLLNASRKRRVAAGSGVDVSDVNQMLKQFDTIKGVMKNLTGGGPRTKRGRRRPPFGGPPFGGGGGFNLPFG